MMVINNNLPALTTYDVVNNTSNQLQKSIQKLSTGLRINSAADDAAGLSISEKMRAQISGLDQAVRNTQDGISLIQTAEGALTETHSILQRMRELSVQAANDTYTAQDRSYIQEEVDLLRDEIDHIGNTTTFNTKKLLNGDSAVLWSSSDLSTKAIVNGGLRNIDQFGQKSSAEGNFKITVAAHAGTGEVQKTDIFKIKHDLDPYAVEGTGKFDGTIIEGEANFDAIGSRTVKVRLNDNVGGSSEYVEYTVKLNHDVEDNAGLAKALNLALTNNEDGGVATVDRTAGNSVTAYTSLGDYVSATEGTNSGVVMGQATFKASVDDSGNLVITSNGREVTLTDDGDDTYSDLSDVFGAANNSDTLRSQEYSATITNLVTGGNLNATTAAATRTYTMTYDLGGKSETITFDVTHSSGNTAVTAAEFVAAANAKFDEEYGAGNVAFNSDATSITSKIGTMRFAATGALSSTTGGTADGTTSLGTISNATTTYTNTPTEVMGTSALETPNIIAATQKTNFGHALNGASFTIKLTDDADGSITGTANEAQTIVVTLDTDIDLSDVDKLVKHLNDKIASAEAATGSNTVFSNGDKVSDHVYARNDGGKVRLYTNMAKMEVADNVTVNGDGTNASPYTYTNATNAGSVNAIFGTELDEPIESETGSGEVDLPALSKVVSKKTTVEGGTTEDMLNVSTASQTFAFNILDDNDETLVNIKVAGGISPVLNDDGSVKTTATEQMVNAINKQLEAANLNDFKAVYDSDTGAINLYSGTRDFKLEDDTSDASYLGYEALLGNRTVAGAEKSETADNPLTTIGMVAKGETVLRDIDKFWDSQGNFLLEDPQTITITQGDGKQAKVTLYKYDTVDDMVNKLNSAIANDLGQAQYLDETDENYKTALNSFVTFVENPEDSGQESVQGTMLIRSVAPGSSGTLNFASNNEDLINALSLNTLKKADDSVYHVTVQDAHTGVVVNNIEDEKITDNVLVGRLHKNVDVEFDAMTGITATWDDDAKEFVLTGAYDDATKTADVTYLHLADNTLVLQIGANEGDDLGVNIGDMRSHALGLDSVLVTDHDSASRSISIIDSAIDRVSTQRAKLGAYQNRLEHTAANLTTSAENLTASESRIRDTDMAKTMMDFTKLQIMLQAGNSMLAQANQLPQNVLSLIR